MDHNPRSAVWYQEEDFDEYMVLADGVVYFFQFDSITISKSGEMVRKVRNGNCRTLPQNWCLINNPTRNTDNL